MPDMEKCPKIIFRFFRICQDRNLFVANISNIRWDCEHVFWSRESRFVKMIITKDYRSISLADVKPNFNFFTIQFRYRELS